MPNENIIILILLLFFLLIFTLIYSNDSFIDIDSDYPGTAVQRLNAVHNRIKLLSPDQFNDDWQIVRKLLLWAGGLKILPDAKPGEGNTDHSFNDFNHCDLTTMLGNVVSNENNGKLDEIEFKNQLGPGITIASIEELGPGGSWTTCMIGCNQDPPHDVAHIQFRSRIAFKLVWVPNNYNTFVLVDDYGNLLAKGQPKGILPEIEERQKNYQLVKDSKYSIEADKLLISFKN